MAIRLTGTPRERCVSAASQAAELWWAFIAATGYTTLDFFRHTVQGGATFCLEDFLRYCINSSQDANAPGPIVSGTYAALAYTPLSSHVTTPILGPASFVCHNSGIPLVALDLDVVEAYVPMGQWSKTVIRLVLHEIGHIAFHWDHLRPDPISGMMYGATPDDEREAWAFAMSVLGTAIGDFACEHRVRRGVDRTWPHA